VKTCKSCHVAKPLEEFYLQKATRDWRMGKCKECWKGEVSLRRRTNPNVREYDRERAKLPHRIANATRVTREWRQRHRDRMKAHNAAARADLVAPSVCEGCGMPAVLDKHHHDYSKPLLVVWLCKPCHVIADRLRRRLESA
jgi:hypothetical protein